MQRRSLGQEISRMSREASRLETQRLVRLRWAELTERDLEDAGEDRAALARRIAERYGIRVGEAKRQVRDFLRVVAVARSPGGKRGRKALQRFDAALPGGDLPGELASGGLGGGVGAGPGGLAGGIGTDPEAPGGSFGRDSEAMVPGGLAGGIGTDPEL
jgi:hypothetical protein